MSDPRLDIKITTTADQRGVDQTVQGLGKLDAATKQTSAGTSTLSQATWTAAKDLQGMSLAGAGVNQAMSGLAQGGIAGAISAVRGLALATKGLAASGLGLLIIPLAAVGAAFYAIGKAADNAREKMLGTGERTKALAAHMKEVGEASEKYIKQATEQANALAAAYDRATTAIDGALSRFKEVESARADAEKSQIEVERQLALSKATTPEERTKINARYDDASAGVDRSSSTAIMDKEFEAAAKGRTEALTKKRLAGEAVTTAEARVAAAKVAQKDALASGSADAFAGARMEFTAAEEALKKVQSTSGKQVEEADIALADNEAKLETLGFKQTAALNTEKATAVGQATSRRPVAAPVDVGKLQARLGDVEEARGAVTPGDFSASNALDNEKAAILMQLDSAAKSMGAIRQGLTEFNKEADETKRTMRTSAEARAGQ